MKNVIAFFLIIYAYSALATPAEVLIIRHAEKPEQGSTLSSEGQAHAQKLATYFTSEPEVLHFGTPVAIYAMAPHREDGSVRAIETVQPLATKLGLTPIESYTKKQYEPMVQDIMSNSRFSGKSVLICWEHKVIEDIVSAFGVSDDPGKWHGDDFDSVYRIDFNADGSIKTFTRLTDH